MVEDPRAALRETVPKLREFHEYGGGTFVDVTGICNGRDIDYYKSLSAKTGVHIVACTGFVGGDTALPFFARATVEYLTRSSSTRSPSASATPAPGQASSRSA